ncbi:MAG: type II toxin-antitoxin system mRNA interferase toxin, RelE/StbE family [Methylobacterium sp.]|nr:MAG: type II toxin-antitoxin system mRNA interferase toxin, RelE/StbE family [Methylobacterium sp.]
MKLLWTARALADLIDIADYVSERNPVAARAMGDRLRGAIDKLPDFPMAGRPGRVAETRELVVPDTPFVVPYRVRNGRIEVLAIFHAARDWPEHF